MASLQDFFWTEAGLGVAALFHRGQPAREWLARLSPLFLPWGEVSRYIKKINQEFGFLNTLGMGRNISIHILKSHNGADQLMDAASLENFSGQSWEMEQILQRVLNEKKTLLMLGAPTSGKTTLLQVLAVRSTDRDAHRRFGFPTPRIPFYIPLKEIDFELPFLQAVQQALLQTSCPISAKGLKRAVQSRRAFFLLDGLDEIPAGEMRDKARAWIESAQQWCGLDLPFVLTCRAGASLQDLQFSIPYLAVAIRNPALSQFRSLRAVSESRMPPRYLNAAEDNAEYVLISPPALSTVLLGAKKPAPSYYYYLSKFPVTNRLYRQFVEATAHRPPAFWDDPEFNGDEVPVVGVDWEDAQAYCAWVTEQARGKGQVASEVVYRLPLEEEWEWAASGGKRKFPWGDDPPQPNRANFNLPLASCPLQGLTPVHAFPDGATPEGLMDMAGNVWEWTATWLDEKKEQRLVRGGGGFNDEVALRCVARDHTIKKLSRFVGFRVARIVPD